MAFLPVEASDVDRAVKSALSEGNVVLAVSGGLDSMVLLSAASGLPSRVRRHICVATFDHGTGRAAGRAAAFVARAASSAGFPCVAGRASTAGTREEEWRRGRWEFLRDVAGKRDARIVTAHTLDDQVETVFMRILRDAGPRGLAGLYADSDVIRPFLDIRRETLACYALQHAIRFVQDPSNVDRRHLRNRIRRALEHISETVEAQAEHDGALRISRSSLAGYDVESLRVLWPALAARASVVMDRRGTQRAAEFTIRGATGGAIQLSGGIEIVMRRDHLLLRRWMPVGRRLAASPGSHRQPEIGG
jgi:tRNA(Ile)-lysidine synthetase-like protein